MISKDTNIKTVDEYIACFPAEIQTILNTLRLTIKEIAPDALEVISYQMPAYKFHGMLLYFAAHTNHLGLYPMASSIVTFHKELKAYKLSKGTIQFPYDKPLPLDLIARIVKFRVSENIEKALYKKKKSKLNSK